MSNYFNKVPNFKYTNLLNDGVDNKTQVKNLFRRVKLREDLYENLNFFTKYFIVGDERPDQVAKKIYNDSNLDWVILTVNNMLNMQSEWPMPQLVYNDYLLEKYGSYEEINETHHYESKRVFNSRNETIFPAGLTVDSTHQVSFYDRDLDVQVTISDAAYRVTNYQYEERVQEKKRSIFILRPEYLNIAIEDLEEAMTYKKGSTEYVSRTLKDTEDLFE